MASGARGDDALKILSVAKEAFVVGVTTGYDVDMTSLPLRHASVPFLYQLLFRVSKGSEIEQHLCGDILEINSDWDEIVMPGGGTRKVSGSEDGLVLDQPGLYVARAIEGRGVAIRMVLAVNVDAEEGDLSRTAHDELGNRIPFATWERISTHEEMSRRMTGYVRGTPIWNHFLYAAVVCFFLEFFLANRAGRRV